MREEIEEIVGVHAVGERYSWEVDKIIKDVRVIFPFSDVAAKKIEDIISDQTKDDREIITAVIENIFAQGKIAYNAKEQENTEEAMRAIERSILLRTVDQHWMNHLDAIDHLRQGIGLRGYGQQDPLIEYKREAFDMFSQLVANIRNTVLHTIFRATVVKQGDSAMSRMSEAMELSGADNNLEQFAAAAQKEKEEMMDNVPKFEKPITSEKTVGRNDPCPCGSGKKYKKCCGK